MQVPEQGPATIPQGQATPAPVESGITGTAPAVESGQSAQGTAPESGQGASHPSPEAESFFDPSSVTPELMPAYKQMQAAFTKKLQGISSHKKKIEAYDAFMADPISNLQQLAQQHGMQLTRAQAREMAEGGSNEEWSPKSWNEVVERIEQRAEERVMSKLSPVLQGVQKLQASNIEAELTKIDPAWQQYEDEMRENLKAHPSLVKDVAKLYRLSVPEEVYTSKAVQKALAKIKGQTDAATVESSTRTSKSQPAPGKVDSFDDAVREARRMLAERR